MEAAGFRPTTGTFNALIQACGNAGDPGKLIVVRAEMEAAGVRPNASTLTALIGAYDNAGDAGKAIEVRAEIEAATGITPPGRRRQQPDRGV